MWGAGTGKEVARENVTNEKEWGWQRETDRQVSVHVKEKEGAKDHWVFETPIKLDQNKLFHHQIQH